MYSLNSFKYKLLLSYIVYGLILVVVALYAVNSVNEADIREHYVENTLQKLTEQTAHIKQHTGSFEKKLFVLRDTEVFKKYLNDDTRPDTDIIELFSYIAYTSKDIMQLRYLDKAGFEKVRVDRAACDSDPELIPNNRLQNKSNRYYFKKIMQLDDEKKSWYSKIDLNIEHGQIEKPVRPVLRIGIPVFVKNEKVGILIVNICMKYILDEISSLSEYNTYLIDKDGDFLIHSQEKYGWGKYLNTKYTLKDHFKDRYQKILDSDEYIDEGLYSKLIDLDNGENIKMIFESEAYKAQEHVQEHVDEMILIMLLLFLLSVPMAFAFSSKFSRLKEEVDILNASLESTVFEKTHKLQMLNITLEQRVEEEVCKNREKEKQMLFQSRLAQMGEMISMIAHQWRQPLSAISLTTGAMKLDIIMDKYKKEFFEESLDKISGYSQHLSSTIDDFRNFFKDNKEKKETTLGDIFEGSLSIIESSLNSNNIKLVKNYKCDEVFISYPNELKQVVLNILKNAEDALLERNIKNPTIYLNTYKQEEDSIYILEIDDNAGGIPKDIMNEIFMPYFSTKKNKEGTGLGLYMSKIIIEEHCHGKLTATNSDEGAVFIIELINVEADDDVMRDENSE